MWEWEDARRARSVHGRRWCLCTATYGVASLVPCLAKSNVAIRARPGTRDQSALRDLPQLPDQQAHTHGLAACSCQKKVPRAAVLGLAGLRNNNGCLFPFTSKPNASTPLPMTSTGREACHLLPCLLALISAHPVRASPFPPITKQCRCGCRLAEERAVAQRLYRSPDHHAFVTNPVPRNPPPRTQTFHRPAWTPQLVISSRAWLRYDMSRLNWPASW